LHQGLALEGLAAAQYPERLALSMARAEAGNQILDPAWQKMPMRIMLPL